MRRTVDFAGAGRPDDGDFFALLDLEIELVEHGEIAESLHHLIEIDNRFIGHFKGIPCFGNQLSSRRTPFEATSVMMR